MKEIVHIDVSIYACRHLATGMVLTVLPTRILANYYFCVILIDVHSGHFELHLCLLSNQRKLKMPLKFRCGGACL